MEIKIFGTESYSTYVVKDSVTIETDNYPELSGMNEEEILEYINLNGSSMKPTDDEYYSDLMEKNFILGKNNNDNTNINLLIDHSNISFYSNIMLEFWDEFIFNLSTDDPIEIINNGDIFKNKIYQFISNKKFNTKNILKYIKNNIKDITEEEITNMIISFDFLNSFGL